MNTRIMNCANAALAFLLIGGCAGSREGGMAQAQEQAATPADKLASPDANQLPPMVGNGLPGPMHQRLNALLGEWQVEMTIYIAGGTKDKPIISRDLTCHREWIAETGNRYLRDVTEGSVGGDRYYRMGLLGYSIMDKVYEWVTVDALNANMMIYHSRGEDSSREISMVGEFTDQGVLGKRYEGKRVGMRTVIRLEGPERNVIELYMTPSNGREFLAARAIYTRRK
jgi:hypothetical protein